MTFILKRVSIKGFLGSRDIDVEFKEGPNFLIGRNGTGKTTFIKLIYSIFTFNEDEYSRLKFDEITITFYDDEKNRSPQLKIEKLSERRAYFRYYFRTAGNEKYMSFSDERDIASQLILKNREDAIQALRRRNKIANQKMAELRGIFTNNIHFSWLPLQRTSRYQGHPYIDYEDDSVELAQDPIDGKIEELVSEMTRFFSTLDSRTAGETRLFQEAYFKSLIAFKAPSIPQIIDRTMNIDLDSQKRSMINIFVELGFSESGIVSDVDVFYSKAKTAADRLMSGKSEGIGVSDLFSIADSIRLNEIVNKFKDYEEKKRIIQKPKTDFSNIISKMMLNKELRFNEANQPEFINKNEDLGKIDIRDLSSGEKQIFVIFAEVLLQNKRRFIFLADEPELSLHIDWQEKLVRNIIDLNENCQLIFATHSPDLVSSHQNSVIDFELL